MSEDLEQRLGYEFQNKVLLVTALTHRSFANETQDLSASDNERLEFLGDAVLDLAVSHMLMERHPTLTEGQLSSARSRLVSEAALSAVAKQLELGGEIRLGKGEEQTGGHDKPSILADTFEAVLAAVYLDGGFEPSRALIERLFREDINGLNPQSSTDYKTRLQEFAQRLLKVAPEYQVITESGPDHDKTFEVSVSVAGEELARATGKAKKSAEQEAARLATIQLKESAGRG